MGLGLVGIGRKAKSSGGAFDRRWAQVKEAVEAMRVCWETEESTYSGSYYQFPPIRCFPKPVQKPSPPVYLPSIMVEGQWSARVFKRIVEWGDGWLPVVQSPRQLQEGLDRIAELSEKANKQNRCRIRILGAEGQWRNSEEIEIFSSMGIEEVILWLSEPSAVGIQKELDLLARSLL